MNAYANANKEFILSPEMKRMGDPTTLSARATQRQYLENRLLEAFCMGIVAGETIATDRMVANITRAR